MGNEPITILSTATTTTTTSTTNATSSSSLLRQSSVEYLPEETRKREKEKKKKEAEKIMTIIGQHMLNAETGVDTEGRTKARLAMNQDLEQKDEAINYCKQWLTEKQQVAKIAELTEKNERL